MAKPSLVERINQVREEAEALIAKRAAEINRDNPNVPIEAIKMSLQRGDCICRTALRMHEVAEA